MKGKWLSMRMSWKLGRFAGIDLFVHPTFLLVLLPGVFAGSESLILLLALFGSVILHEFGHALTARRFGIETHDITLYPIGGVARLARMPRAPGAELLITLAGPAVNFAILGLLLSLRAIGIDGLAGRTSLEAMVGLVMLVNLGLGLFNLVPAFPMDGGRILRALLSGWLGRARATTIAAGIGRALAIAFGLFSLVYTQSLFHVALAMFIYFAAGAEQAGVLADERRRASLWGDQQGQFHAPPGYRWVETGRGIWQLAPIVVTGHGPGRNTGSWNG
jgi:Zn-dependent protease